MSSHAVAKQAHHERAELCTNRPRYRQGRRLTAVRVYSVNDESKYLLVHGVPSISIVNELEALCQRFGSVEELKRIPDYPCEKFTEVYQVKFHTLPSARFAKIKLDDKNFFGGVLHVCYAPELETRDETREKLAERQRVITKKLQPQAAEFKTASKSTRIAKTLPSLSEEDTSSTAVENPQNTNQNLHVPDNSPSRFVLFENTSITALGDSQTIGQNLCKENLTAVKTTASNPRKTPAVKRIVYHQKPKIPKLS